MSRRLRDACAGRNVTEVARTAGVPRTTVYNVLAGHVWCDIATLASLEETLGVRLWPDAALSAEAGPEPVRTE